MRGIVAIEFILGVPHGNTTTTHSGRVRDLRTEPICPIRFAPSKLFYHRTYLGKVPKKGTLQIRLPLIAHPAFSIAAHLHRGIRATAQFHTHDSLYKSSRAASPITLPRFKPPHLSATELPEIQDIPTRVLPSPKDMHLSSSPRHLNLGCPNKYVQPPTNARGEAHGLLSISAKI